MIREKDINHPYLSKVGVAKYLKESPMSSQFRCKLQYRLKDRRPKTPITTPQYKDQKQVHLSLREASQVLDLIGIIIVSKAHYMFKPRFDPINCKSSSPFVFFTQQKK